MIQEESVSPARSSQTDAAAGGDADPGSAVFQRWWESWWAPASSPATSQRPAPGGLLSSAAQCWTTCSPVSLRPPSPTFSVDSESCFSTTVTVRCIFFVLAFDLSNVVSFRASGHGGYQCSATDSHSRSRVMVLCLLFLSLTLIKRPTIDKSHKDEYSCTVRILREKNPYISIIERWMVETMSRTVRNHI